MSQKNFLSTLSNTLPAFRCKGLAFLAAASLPLSAALPQDAEMVGCRIRADMYRTAAILKNANTPKSDAIKIALDQYKNLPRFMIKTSLDAIDQVYQIDKNLNADVFYDGVLENCVRNFGR